MTRILPVLLVSVAGVAACARRGPELRDPVGLTMVTSAPARPQGAARRGEDAGAARAAPADVGRYVIGEGAGPCGMNELPVIEFASGSTNLDRKQTTELERLAACLTAAPFESSSVILVGYTDVMGTAPQNLALGLGRAQSVMRQLIDGGVSPARIVVASAGELQRPRARWGVRANRVEILVGRGGPPRPDEAPVARGIDAEGLLPRAPRAVVGGTPPPGPFAPPPSPPMMSGGPPGGYAPSRPPPPSRGR